MARVIALAPALRVRSFHEIVRVAIVCGCALALIAAGRALPFIA